MHALPARIETRHTLFIIILAIIDLIKTPADYLASLDLQVSRLESVTKNSNVVRIQIFRLRLNI